MIPLEKISTLCNVFQAGARQTGATFFPRKLDGKTLLYKAHGLS
jgi:hypothetical protein